GLPRWCATRWRRRSETAVAEADRTARNQFPLSEIFAFLQIQVIYRESTRNREFHFFGVSGPPMRAPDNRGHAGAATPAGASLPRWPRFRTWLRSRLLRTHGPRRNSAHPISPIRLMRTQSKNKVESRRYP